MVQKDQLSYQGLAIGLLLSAQSGLQGDLETLRDRDLLDAGTCKSLLRHALYFETSPFATGTFNPKEPDPPDPDIEEAIGLVNFDEMVEGIDQFLAAGEAIRATIGNLLFYDGGSCPISAQQPSLHDALRQFGASWKRRAAGKVS